MPTKAWRTFLAGDTGSDVIVMQTTRRLLLLVLLLMWWSSSLHVSLVMARSRSKGSLEFWIDDKQVKALVGVEVMIPIIRGGDVIPYLEKMDIGGQLIIPPEVDTVNLTWQAGNNKYTYVFDKFQSLDQRLLYQPLLGIPVSGTIPRLPQVFQITIPCKGTEAGLASLLLGLTIYDQWRHPIKGTPMEFRLKKQCIVFATSSRCKYGCRNGGKCNHKGVCDCPTGFEGDMCEVALCAPRCQNNGTCISPSTCACQPGFHGAFCEKAACGRPCQNGGHCLPEGFCWCANGFFGDACEYSPCNPHCQNGGTCIGHNHCQCTDFYTGPLCDHSLTPSRPDSDRPRRSKADSTTRAPRKKAKPRGRFRAGKNLERKLQKAEQRLLRITLRKSRKWGISKNERRTLRALKRGAESTPLTLQQRRYLIKLMTRERKHLNSKDKTKLKRFKNLIRQAKRKQKKPRKRRVFV